MQALEEALGTQQAALDTRDEFLRALAHDLKAPLSNLSWHVQMLNRRARDGQLEPDALDKGLQAISIGSAEAVAAIDELHDLTRLAAGSPLPLQLEPVDLVALVRQLVAARLETSRHDVEFVSDYETLTGHVDRARLARMLDNLLDNATKYSPGGGQIRLSVDREVVDGAESAVLRVQEGPKGLALTTDVTPRYCEADPFEGGKQAVAETWRNLSAVGAKPMALTDNLNFGNPERPEIMGQLVGCIQGIAAACKTLEFPVVSGNVSLYNETNGRAILPTPTIGGVGLLDDFSKSASIGFKAADDLIVLLGETKGWLGQSLYLRDICGREEGAPPPVDLMAERRVGDFVRGLIGEQFVSAVHDLSDGGLVVAVAEMALASGIGARLYGAPAFLNEIGFWFGEDQARYVVTIKPAQFDDLAARAKTAGVPIRRIGVTHGNALTLPGERAILLEALRERHEGWLPAYMAGGAN